MKLIFLFSLIVSWNTWTTPQPYYNYGKIINYGDYSIIESTAKYNGYNLKGYKGGVSSISPVHIGQIVWIKDSKGIWQGAYLIVDVSRQHDFYTIVYEYNEILEVPKLLLDELGLPLVSIGEIYIDKCPPNEYNVENYPRNYKPKLELLEGEYKESIYKYPLPKQELPIDCK